MRKAERDAILDRLQPAERQAIHLMLREGRMQLKTSPGIRVTARQVLASQRENLSPQQIEAMEAIVARDETGPSVGEQPPDFSLKRLGSDGRVTLAEFRGHRPVALVFGSYT